MYEREHAPRMCSLSYSFCVRVSTIVTPCLREIGDLLGADAGDAVDAPRAW